MLAPESDALLELVAELEKCTLSATRGTLTLESMHMRVASIAAGLCEVERERDSGGSTTSTSSCAGGAEVS